MKTIKTKKSVKNIKVLNKSVNLSKRIKNSFIRTKERAKETQNSRYNSPEDYASNNIQEKTQNVVQKIIRNLPNPRQKANKNIQRAKGYFQEVKNKFSGRNIKAANQGQKTANTVPMNAEKLKNTAYQAKETAQSAKKAVKEAKQTLREVRHNGRQTLKEIKQNAKNITVSNFSISNLPKNPANVNQTQGNIPKSEPVKSVGTPKNEIPRFNSGISDITPKKSGSMPNIQTNTNVLGNHKKNRQVKIYKVEKRKVKNITLLNNKSNPTRGSIKAYNTPTADKALNVSNSIPNNNISRPNYVYKRNHITRKTGDTAKSFNNIEKTAKSTINGFKETTKGTIKTAKKSVKTAEKSAKTAVKTARQVAKTAQKTAQASAKAEKVTRATVHATKAVVKAIIATVKVTITALKGISTAIIAGGWIAVFIILIICLIALIVGSVFGIFFSSEPNPVTGQSLNSVIAEIDEEYTDNIDDIISENPHDILDMPESSIIWKQVLAVYTVKTVSNRDNPMEVTTMNDEKAAILREVFWDMNYISYTIETVEVDEDILDVDGQPTGETVKVEKTVLRITATSKSLDEISEQYSFTAEQKDWLNELLQPQYDNFWNALLL